MCFCYDGDDPEFYRESRPVARKEHRCYECGRTICRGERYFHVAGKWDTVQHFRICETCEKARQVVHDHEIAEGCGEEESWPGFGELTGYLIGVGHGATDDGGDAERLTPGALALHGSLDLALALQRHAPVGSSSGGAE